MADWKDRLGVVFSTNPDFEYDNGAEEQPETLAPAKQKLRVWRDTHGRAGKVATVVRGFVGSDDDLHDGCLYLLYRLRACNIEGKVYSSQFLCAAV